MGDITIPAAVVTHAFAFVAGAGFIIVLLHSIGSHAERKAAEASADD